MSQKNIGHAMCEVAQAISDLVEQIDKMAVEFEDSFNRVDEGKPETRHTITHMVGGSVDDLMKARLTLAMMGLRIRSEQAADGDLAEVDKVTEETMLLLADKVADALSGLMGRAVKSKESLPNWAKLHDKLIEELEAKVAGGGDQCNEKHESPSESGGDLMNMLKTLNITPPKPDTPDAGTTK